VSGKLFYFEMRAKAFGALVVVDPNAHLVTRL
jgi:hypothetical protein